MAPLVWAKHELMLIRNQAQAIRPLLCTRYTPPTLPGGTRLIMERNPSPRLAKQGLRRNPFPADAWFTWPDNQMPRIRRYARGRRAHQDQRTQCRHRSSINQRAICHRRCPGGWRRSGPGARVIMAGTRRKLVTWKWREDQGSPQLSAMGLCATHNGPAAAELDVPLVGLECGGSKGDNWDERH